MDLSILSLKIGLGYNSHYQKLVIYIGATPMAHPSFRRVPPRDRQICRLIAHATTAAGLEDTSRVVQDLVLGQG